jgi:hypothetical protein
MLNKNKINALTQHKFLDCHDIPQLSCLGIFSCSACGKWRERIHSHGFGKGLPQRRDFLSDRYQCSRTRKGLGAIRIRVFFNGAGPLNEDLMPSGVAASENDKENRTGNVVPWLKLAAKTKLTEEVKSKLESSKRSRLAKELQEKVNCQMENEKKDERAKQVKMNLEAAKEFKAVEEMRQLCMKKDKLEVKNMEMDSILKGKQAELDVLSDKLLGLMMQISKASDLCQITGNS